MGLPPGEGASIAAGGAPPAADAPRPAAPPPSPAAAPRAGTGDERVDQAVARLADLAGLPVAEHPPVFEYVHERLTEALGDLDVRDQARPGAPNQAPHRPGMPGRPGMSGG